MSSPILQAHVDVDPSGQCKLALRQRGDTTLGDVVVVKELDKSSPKLQQSVCDGAVGGAPFSEVIIDVISSDQGGQEPYLRPNCALQGREFHFC